MNKQSNNIKGLLAALLLNHPRLSRAVGAAQNLPKQLDTAVKQDPSGAAYVLGLGSGVAAIPALSYIGRGTYDQIKGTYDQIKDTVDLAPKPDSAAAAPIAQKVEQFVQKGSEGNTAADTKEHQNLNFMQFLQRHPYAAAAGVGVPALLLGGAAYAHQAKKKRKPEEQEPEGEEKAAAAFLPGWR